MMWLSVLPLIIDLIKVALKLISTLQDPIEKSVAKENLRTTLKDYDVHQDVVILQSALREIGNGGAKR